jgi:hypothetical protein
LEKRLVCSAKNACTVQTSILMETSSDMVKRMFATYKSKGTNIALLSADPAEE